MDIGIFPNTIDYWGPTGMVFYLNRQARYTFPMGPDEFSISLENPSTALSVGQFRDTPDCDLPNAPADCASVDSTASDVFQVSDYSVLKQFNHPFINQSRALTSFLLFSSRHSTTPSLLRLNRTGM